jgi:hypothetical protein
MPIPAQLCVALADYVANHYQDIPPDSWDVAEDVWQLLGTGFDHRLYDNDRARQNVELKHHLSRHWQGADHAEKMRLANWIVFKWGRIRRNRPMTLLGYINQVDAAIPATPLYGIASYSKILAMKDPVNHAIYDSRVAVSLNALQLLLRDHGHLGPSDLIAFPVPTGRSPAITQFADAVSPAALGRVGFTNLHKDETYDTYLALLREVAGTLGRPIIDVEMFLYAMAPALCVLALPLAQQIPSALLPVRRPSADPTSPAGS